MSLPGTFTADDPFTLEGESFMFIWCFRGLSLQRRNGPQTQILLPGPYFSEPQRMVRIIIMSLSDDTHLLL
jgi:hypothetical protein